MKTKIIAIVMLSLFAGSLWSGCKKKKEEDPQPYASFSAGGVNYALHSASKFGKLCVYSYFCGDFMADKAFSDKNLIGFGFPQDVAAGKIYQTGDHHFICYFMDSAGKRYYSSSGGTMIVQVTQWDGNGGWVKGTFSGTLASEANPANDSVLIQNGKFEGLIYYIE